LRILEFRNRGFSDVESVKLGFCLSAGTITTAGVIMMISFGFLLVASQEILGQWGFYIGEPPSIPLADVSGAPAAS
jgi:hypothetical protein